jgi:hypothetical protein
MGGMPGMMPGGGEAPGAKASMILAIVGFFCFGIIMGPIAIVKALGAKKAIQQNPALTGGGMATVGLILGIIDVVFNILGLIWNFALRS